MLIITMRCECSSSLFVLLVSLGPDLHTY